MKGVFCLNKKELIIFENQEVKLEVNMKDETVWLTQKQMAELFNKSRTNITMHINNVFREGELDEKGNVSFIDIALSDKPVKVYSLDVIISWDIVLNLKMELYFVNGQILY